MAECQPASTGIDKDDLSIPLIDFESFLNGTPAEKQSVAIAITTAFKTSGFLYLKNHSIPPSVVAETFASSARFFALLRNTIPDLKETMEIGSEGVENCPNPWPDHLDDEGKDFKRIMLGFSATCKDLHVQILRAIAIGMNLPPHFFDEFTAGGRQNFLRLLHYHSTSKEVFRNNPEQVRAGAHSDYNVITLLFQDSQGGLQVRSPNGSFVHATPIADTIVVNAGDLLARWSNDIIRSTCHRVVEPLSSVDDKTPDVYPSRYSIAYFCNPSSNAFIDALPGTYGDGIGEKKYEGVMGWEYLIGRLKASGLS